MNIVLVYASLTETVYCNYLCSRKEIICIRKIQNFLVFLSLLHTFNCCLKQYLISIEPSRAIADNVNLELISRAFIFLSTDLFIRTPFLFISKCFRENFIQRNSNFYVFFFVCLFVCFFSFLQSIGVWA